LPQIGQALNQYGVQPLLHGLNQGMADVGQGLSRVPVLRDLATAVNPGLNALGTPQQALQAASQGLNQQAQQHVIPQNIVSRGIADVGEGIPFFAGGAELGPEAVGGTLLSRIGQRAISGALTNAPLGAAQGFSQAQPGQELQGTALGALGAAIGGGIAKPLAPLIANPIQSTRTTIQNAILNRLQRRAEGGQGPLTPEETAMNMQQNFTGPDGKPLPVDIGTAAQSPGLQSIYNATQYTPFSGTAQKIAQVQTGQATKPIMDIAQHAGIDTTGKTIPQISQEMDAIHGAAQDKVTQALAQVDAPAAVSSATVDATPDILKQMSSAFQGATNKAEVLSSSVNNELEAKRAVQKQIYGPVNDAENMPIPGNAFNNYAQAAAPLIQNKDILLEGFGNASDLKSQVSKEIGNAENLLTNPNENPLTLGAAKQKMQTLGSAAARLSANGNRQSASQLTSLRQGLQQDVDSYLRNSGNSNIADAWLQGNEYHQQEILPHENTPIIRKITQQSGIPSKINAGTYATKPYVPKSSAKLSDELLDPNNANIIRSLPTDVQNAAIIAKLTNGKNISGFTPEKTAAAWNGLDEDVQNSIGRVNPDIKAHLDNLQSEIDARNSAIQNQTGATKQYLKSAINDAQNIGGMKDNLSKAIQNRYNTVTPQSKVSKGASMLLGAGTGLAPFAAYAGAPLIGLPALLGGLGSTALGRTASKTLSNPALLEAYMNRSRFGVNQNMLSQALSKGLPRLVGTQTVGNQ
jgi:gas vesicle protein